MPSRESDLGQPLLTDREAAEWLGVSTTTVRRERYLGHLHFVRVAGAVRIRPEALSDYLATRGQEER